MLIVLFLWMATGCSTQKSVQDASVTTMFYDPYRFNYYPAGLILLNGDTINGRFTKSGTLFLLIHENKDSNYNVEKRRNWATLPSYYYKKFPADSLKAYIVNDHCYEPVIITNKQTDNARLPANSSRYLSFMERFTRDSSSLRLYRYMIKREIREPEKTILAELIMSILSGHGDTTISGGDYDFAYYLHFPGEHPLLVWNLDNVSISSRLKEMFVAIAVDCSALAETARQLQQTDRHREIIRALVRPDTIIKTSGLKALSERLEKYDECYRMKRQ